MQNYKKSGAVVTRTAPAGGVTAGEGYKIGQLLVIAQADAAAGEEFEGVARGEVELTKKAADGAWSEGDILYWDDTNKELTDTSAAGYLQCGTAANAAADAAATGIVLLDAIGRADQV